DTPGPAAPTFTAAPASPASDLTPTWSFTAEPGAIFQCRVDRGATIISDWAACSSPDTVDLSLQPDGTYTLSVRATDPAGNTGTVATRNYTLDTAAPAAPSVTAAPSSPGNGAIPSWSFSGELGASFQCRLDRGGTAVAGGA